MRQVFTSPRLENVERVAALLKEHGVDARITNGRSFKGSIRGNFSYRDHARTGPQPAVWVVKSDDQPKARELLREAGLLDSGRSPTSYLSTAVLHAPREGDAEDAAKRRVFRIKAALLLSIAAAIGLALFASRKPAITAKHSPATAAQITMMTPSATDDVGSQIHVVETPSALAAMLLSVELRARATGTVCLSVDGSDPSEKVLAQLQRADTARFSPQSTCSPRTGTEPLVSIEVRDYRTDGSGSGTVQVGIADTDANGQPRVEIRTLEVERDGLDWNVKRILP